jgi:hypothetical protein
MSLVKLKIFPEEARYDSANNTFVIMAFLSNLQTHNDSTVSHSSAPVPIDHEISAHLVAASPHDAYHNYAI